MNIKFYPAKYFCNYCIYCGQQITAFTWYYGNKTCRGCSAEIQFNKQHSYCDCGKEIRSDNKRCRKCWTKYESVQRMGKENPAYIDGRSYEPYPLEWTEILKETIRQRDNHTCQNCEKKQSELKGFFKKLDVHHIDYDKENLNPENLISLCHKCNGKANKNRDYWFAYFTYIRGGLR